MLPYFTLPSLQASVQAFGDTLQAWITSPVIVTILLSVAFAGLAVEMFTPGFGAGGILGIAAGGIFLYGHIAGGLATSTDILLLTAAIILLVLELFVPGGIMGILGMIGLLWALFRMAADRTDMMISVSIAFVVTVIAVIYIIRIVGFEKGMFKPMILQDTLRPDTLPSLTALIGQRGVAKTPLRPTGTAEIGDSVMEVITEGRYVAKGSEIVVIRTEGKKIIVSSVTNKEEKQ
ncbi:NfeD family protein [Terribacillus saccharophilus]|uniref:NfeD family protein n=1 Tax=Terribacillus saccharophilus TaxID=361277 RepID=UPI003981C2FC